MDVTADDFAKRLSEFWRGRDLLSLFAEGILNRWAANDDEAG